MKSKKLNIVLIIFSITIFVLLFFAKDKLNCFVTNYHLRNNDAIITKSDSVLFFEQFDNSSNQHPFELSLIELGGAGCLPCMRMDTVLTEIGEKYKEKINVKVYRVSIRENRKYAKYLGANTIPTQIIMNKTGEEVFRHTGFLSREELEKMINKFN